MDQFGNALNQTGKFFTGIGQDIGNTIENVASGLRDNLSNDWQGLSKSIQQPQIPSINNPVAQDATSSLLPMILQQGQYALQGKNVFGQQQPWSLSNPFAPAPRINAANQINTGNPVADFALKTAVGIPQSILNVPSDIQQGVGQTGQDIQSGKILQPQVAVSDIASIGLPIATLATLPMGGEVAEQAMQQGFGQALKEGALTGTKFGAGFGFGAGLQSGRNITNPQQYLQNLATNVGAGSLAGLAVGGTLGGASNLIGRGLQNMKDNEAVTLPDGLRVTREGINKFMDLKPQIDANYEQYANDPNIWQKLLPQDNFNDWYKSQEMNHTPGGPEALKDANGYFTFVNPFDMPPKVAESGDVMKGVAFDQFVSNNGVSDLPVVKQTYDENGNPNPLDITDGHHRFPISRSLGHQLVPVVMLDDKAPLLSDSFNQIKSGTPMRIGITSAQQANPQVAQFLDQGAKQMEAGDINGAIKTLQNVTDTTKGQLTDLLNDGATQVSRLETNTHGLYFGTPEPSYWLDLNSNNSNETLASLAKFAKDNQQDSFITGTKSQAGQNLGLSMNFGRPLSNEEVVAVQRIANAEGLGLTINQRTGETYSYNISQFDGLNPEEFKTKAEQAITALQAGGFKFSKSLDKYNLGVYTKDNYDGLISKSNRFGQVGAGLQPEGTTGGNISAEQPKGNAGSVLPQNAQLSPQETSIVKGRDKSIDIKDATAKVTEASKDVPVLQDVVDNATNAVNGVSQVALKDPQSLAQKVADDKGRTLENNPDTIRSTILAMDKDKAQQALDILKQDPTVQVVKEKNKVNPKTGYDAQHLQVKLPSGQTAEIQAHTPESLQTREIGHDQYKGEGTKGGIPPPPENIPTTNIFGSPQNYAVLTGLDKNRQEAGLPIPQQQWKNPIAGKGDMGDIPPFDKYGNQGKGAFQPGGAIPETQTPKPIGGIKALAKSLFVGERKVLADSPSTNANLFIKRLEDAANNHEDMASSAITALANARKALKPNQYAFVVDLAEGKVPMIGDKVDMGLGEAQAQEIPPEIKNWLQAWDTVRKDIATKAKAIDLQTLDPEGGMTVPWEGRDNYFPHYVTKEQMDQIRANPDATLDGIIRSGKASNAFEARLYLDKQLDALRARRFGNLEMHRGDIDIPYLKDPRIAEDYVNGAYKRIAYANQFGAFNQDGQRLVDNMIGEGRPYESNVASDLLKQVTGYRPQSPEEQGVGMIGRAVRAIETPMKLGLISLHHGGQVASIAARSGLGNMLRTAPQAVSSLLFDNQSPFARNAVLELHDLDNKYDLYGGSSRLDQKFLGVVGFDRVIKTLRAWGADAAQMQAKQFETKLDDSTTARFLKGAGLDYDAIRQRGYLTQPEVNQYARSALKDTALLFQPGDLPKLWNTPVGRLMTMFKTFGYNQATKFVPYIFREARAGNVAPAIAFLTLGTGIGTGEQVFQNLIQNKPAPTIGKTIVQGALRGANPGIIGSTIANTIMYPQYTASNLVGLVGGPVASDVMNVGGLVNNALNPPQGQNQVQIKNNQITANRDLIRNVPLVGSTLANTLFPYKSYVGNRPSDVLSGMLTGQPITHGTGDFAYQTTPTVADLLRPNPTVIAQTKQATTIAKNENSIKAGLDANRQTQLDTINNLLQLPYNGGNQLDKIHAYGLLANDGQLALAKSQMEASNAKTTKDPVNPLWQMGLVNPQAQNIVLQYKALLPADQKAFKSDPTNLAILNSYNAAETDYYNSLPPTKQTQQFGIVAPSPSKDVQNLLNQAKSTKNYSLYNDSKVQAYFAQLDYYDNYINGLAGLPPGAGGTTKGGGGGYGSSNGYIGNLPSNYLERAQLRSFISQAMMLENQPVPMRFKGVGGFQQQLRQNPININALTGNVALAPRERVSPVLGQPKVGGVQLRPYQQPTSMHGLGMAAVR